MYARKKLENWIKDMKGRKIEDIIPKTNVFYLDEDGENQTTEITQLELVLDNGLRFLIQPASEVTRDDEEYSTVDWLEIGVAKFEKIVRV